MVNLDNYPAVQTALDSEGMFGYTQRTTFWDDFSIADMFGEEGIRDTYNRAFKHWKHDTVFVTELCMVLNWKMFYFAEIHNDRLGRLYEELFAECDEWCIENLKGDDLSYFIRTTD